MLVDHKANGLVAADENTDTIVQSAFEFPDTVITLLGYHHKMSCGHMKINANKYMEYLTCDANLDVLDM